MSLLIFRYSNKSYKRKSISKTALVLCSSHMFWSKSNKIWKKKIYLIPSEVNISISRLFLNGQDDENSTVLMSGGVWSLWVPLYHPWNLPSWLFDKIITWSEWCLPKSVCPSWGVGFSASWNWSHINTGPERTIINPPPTGLTWFKLSTELLCEVAPPPFRYVHTTHFRSFPCYNTL